MRRGFDGSAWFAALGYIYCLLNVIGAAFFFSLFLRHPLGWRVLGTFLSWIFDFRVPFRFV